MCVFLRRLVAGEHLSSHASTGGKQWSSGTATVAAIWSLCLSLTYTFGKLSLSIPLWQSFPFLHEFLLSIIPVWFRKRSHIDAQESAMLISVQEFPQTLGNKTRAGGERRRRGRRSTPVKTVTSIHFSSIALVAFSTSGVMDFTGVMKAQQCLSPYSAHVSWLNVKTSSLLNL